MFNWEGIAGVFVSDKDGILLTEDSKFALYYFNRGDKYEFRLEYVADALSKKIDRHAKTDQIETLARFYMPVSWDREVQLSTLHTLLRNCLLVERLSNE
jgi:hypothetical protein